jgi:integrative and conjugative element protein (TIGR02256 family)
LITDAALIQELQDARGTKLPNETGGVLLGSFDVSRRLLYVTTTTGSPPDSVEYPVHYIRGCEGLREEVRHAESRTGGMIQYVGEWHSHPDGVSCCPSGDDRTVFEWIRSYIQPGGLPPLMCIVGEGREAWYLGEMVK